jgi:hypothetical protein
MKFLIYFMTIYIKMFGVNNNNNKNNNNKKMGVMVSVFPTTKPTYLSSYANRFTQNPIGSPGLTGGWMNIKPASSSNHTKSA